MKRYQAVLLVIIAVAWLGSIATYLFWDFGPKAEILGFRTQAMSAKGGYIPGASGNYRTRVLIDLTEEFRQEYERVPARVAGGDALAPPDYLNRQLEKQDRKWRVRKIDGLKAEIYEVS